MCLSMSKSRAVCLDRTWLELRTQSALTSKAARNLNPNAGIPRASIYIDISGHRDCAGYGLRAMGDAQTREMQPCCF